MEVQEKAMEVVGRKTINDVPFRIHSYMDECSINGYFIMLDSDILLCIKPIEDKIEFLTKDKEGVYVTLEEASCYRPTRREMQLVMNAKDIVLRPEMINFLDTSNESEREYNTFQMKYYLKE